MGKLYLKPAFYKDIILKTHGVDIDVTTFRGNGKWSDRMKSTFLSQGSEWNDRIELKVKESVAKAIPDKITSSNINSVVIKQKAGFLQGLTTVIKQMIQE